MHLIVVRLSTPTEFLMFAIYLCAQCISFTRSLIACTPKRPYALSAPFIFSILGSIRWWWCCCCCRKIIAWHCHFSMMVLHSLNAPSLLLFSMRASNSRTKYRLKYRVYIACSILARHLAATTLKRHEIGIWGLLRFLCDYKMQIDV